MVAKITAEFLSFIRKQVPKFRFGIPANMLTDFLALQRVMKNQLSAPQFITAKIAKEIIFAIEFYRRLYRFKKLKKIIIKVAVMRIYENIKKTSENRLNPRAYYIPKGVSEYKLLNGVWDFAFFEDNYNIPFPSVDNWHDQNMHNGR